MSELEKRASDAEHEHTVVQLREASTDGRLTLEELAERTALAYRARTHADLEPLTADLPAVAASIAPAVASRRRWLIAVFAPVTRSGRRAFGERNVVLTIFGPARLDLRQAQVSGGEAVITVFTLFAPVFVTVPEHIDVESSIVALLAPVQEGAPGDVPPNARRVRIRGFSLFGPVFIQSSRR